MIVQLCVKWLRAATGNAIASPSGNDTFYTLLVFFGVLGLTRLVQWYRRVRSLPPGPWGLPLFGYLPFMDGDVHLKFAEMAKKYGSMFSAKLGTQLVVVLSDYRIIRETFRREEFTGRPHTEFNNILGGYGEFNFVFCCTNACNSGATSARPKNLIIIFIIFCGKIYERRSGIKCGTFFVKNLTV